MKQLIYSISIIVCTILASCSSTQKTSETIETAPEVESTVSQDQSQETTVSAKSDNADNKDLNMVTGKDIVYRTAKMLNSKLQLNDSQEQKIINFLTNSFVASGNDIQGSYTSENARTMSKDLVNSSKTSIMPVLDETQKDLLEQILNK